MNAPARIRPQRPANDAVTPAAEARGEKLAQAYRETIAMHCPGQDDMMMAVRLELALLRDQASRGISHANHSAGVLLMQVSSLAAEAVFAPAPFGKLDELHGALKMTMLAARMLERATRSDG